MSPLRGRRKRSEINNKSSASNKRLKQELPVSEEKNETSSKKSTLNGELSSNETFSLMSAHADTNGYSNCNGCNGEVSDSLLNSPKLKENSLNSFHAKFAKSNIEASCVSELIPGKHACFACKLRNGDLVKCSIPSCDKFYHAKCLENLPTSKSELNACPLHLCLTCYNANPKNPAIARGQMYKCFKCPTAFHAKDECIIPGSVILTHDIMSCPDHFSPETQREYDAVTNLLFCTHCGCNKNLLFCSFCPASIHKECLKKAHNPDKKYVCDRCESRKVIFFDDVVWAKIYNFRWWPAKVLNPKTIPPSVVKMKHFEGEFPIQFFGTDEYFWTQKGRVYPFILKKVGVEDFGLALKHNFKKQIPDEAFNNALNLASEAAKNKLIKLAEPINNKKPPTYRHIKSNRPIGKVQIYTVTDLSEYTFCGCRPTDKTPCGYDSLCLNRSMCFECHPDVCEAGESCQNQKFQKRQNAAAEPFYTEDRGWGLKALENIKEGHFVIEYIGDLIDEQECDRRIMEKQACGDTNFYFCTLDSNRIIDAGPKGNFSRFINHSCDPNCETQKWMVNGDCRVGVFARKNIPAGSEITFDYQMDFSHFEKLKCNCGSTRCSGLIGKKPQNGLVKVPNAKNFSSAFKNIESTLNVDAKKKKAKNKPKIIDQDNSKPMCYKCSKPGKLLICAQESCGKGYHVRCVNTKITDPKKWECPIHFCRKCSRNSEHVCDVCPNAYCKKHVKKELLTNKTFLCVYHSKPN